MSQLQLESQESKFLHTNSEFSSQKSVKKILTKQEYIEQMKNFFKLLGSLLFSVFKLCWILIFRFIIFVLKSALKPLVKKITNFLEKIVSDGSLNLFLQHSIVVVSSLEQRIPQCFDSFLTKIRSNKKSKSLPFSQRKQYSDQELKQMFLEPANYLESPSNQVLCKLKEGKKKMTITYCVPTYLRVLLKNFTSIDLGKLQAEVNANIIITFVYGNKGILKLPKQVANRLNDEVVLNFERDQPLRLTSTDCDHVSVKQEEHKSYITFTVRRKFRMKIESDVAYTPFQRLDLLLPITIQQITPSTIQQPQQIFHESFLSKMKQDTTFQAGIRFNFMDNPAPFVKLDFKDETSFGHYSIIQSGLQTKYSDKKILSKQQEQKKKIETQKQKIKNENELKKLDRKKLLLSKTRSQKQKKVLAKQIEDLEKRQDNKMKLSQQKRRQQQDKKKDPDFFQYSCFKIPIYKHPFASLIEIFLPLWSLAIINLGIYFQDGGLSDRIASIAGVMIAFIALIPLIRSEIPPNPKVVFVEYLVYLEILASLLCLIDSLNVRSQVDYHMVWYGDIFFLISLFIFLAQIIAISLLSINHYAICVHAYELDQDEQQWKKDKNKNKFNHFLWGNKDCDKKFDYIIQHTKQNVQNMKNNWQGKLSDLKEQIQSQKKSTLHQKSNKKAFERFVMATQRYQKQEENPFKKTQSKLLIPTFTINPLNQQQKNVESTNTKKDQHQQMEGLLPLSQKRFSN